MTATFFVHDEQSTIPVTIGGVALPNGSAFMLPGIYMVLGVSYDCTRQGLYRWFNPAGNFIQRIVVASGAALDPYALVSSISHNHVHGTGTEGDHQAMANQGRYRMWSARCGYIAGMVAWLMPQLGWTARVRNVKTLEAENGYDDGHLVLETLHGNEWRMWDMTAGCYFLDANGKHLSCDAFMAQIANGGTFPEAVKLSHHQRYEHDYINPPALDLGLYWKHALGTPELAEAWYRRIFQAYI